jgi:hypothetical protein
VALGALAVSAMSDFLELKRLFDMVVKQRDELRSGIQALVREYESGPTEWFESEFARRLRAILAGKS